MAFPTLHFYIYLGFTYFKEIEEEDKNRCLQEASEAGSSEEAVFGHGTVCLFQFRILCKKCGDRMGLKINCCFAVIIFVVFEMLKKNMFSRYNYMLIVNPCYKS